MNTYESNYNKLSIAVFEQLPNDEITGYSVCSNGPYLMRYECMQYGLIIVVVIVIIIIVIIVIIMTRTSTEVKVGRLRRTY